MPHLKFHGRVLKQYHGIDKDTVLVAGAGDVIHVSEEKANRLLKDFPVEFELHHVKGDDKPSPPAEMVELDDANLGGMDEPVEVKNARPMKNKMVGKAKKIKKDKWL